MTGIRKFLVDPPKSMWGRNSNPPRKDLNDATRKRRVHRRGSARQDPTDGTVMSPNSEPSPHLKCGEGSELGLITVPSVGSCRAEPRRCTRRFLVASFRSFRGGFEFRPHMLFGGSTRNFRMPVIFCFRPAGFLVGGFPNYLA